MAKNLLRVILVAWAIWGNVHAAVIIGNSVTGPYQPGTNGGTKAVGFTTGSSSLLLDDIQVALGGHDSSGGSLTFTLNANAGGAPGSVLSTLGTQFVVGQSATAAYTLTPVSPITLNPNTTYWIQTIFSGAAPPAWDQTNPAVAPSSGLATFLGYVINTGGGFGPSSTFNAIIVEGRALTAPVPEPETYGMLIAGLGLLAFVSRRRKR